mmetsp:Transcript_21168/g.29655  ORF Transcript_21168/g.29655 Transcript_21168/m.29655 type:complete len:228 (-) Transcript_21168:368-1051(-)
MIRRNHVGKIILLSMVIFMHSVKAFLIAPTKNNIIRTDAFSSTQITFKSTSITTTTSLGMGIDFVDPSYNLAIGTFGIGLASGFLEDLRDGEGEKLLTAKPFGALALLFTLFAAFLTFQTFTLRFAFDDDSFSLVRSNDGSSIGENVVVGGENKWKYTSFRNWEFLPNEKFPILVYFREDQTPVDSRETVPLVVDNLEGQVHFFPAISNSQELKEGFLKNGCSRVEK